MTGPAPRPVAEVDTEAALYLADAFAAISVGFGHPTLESHNAAGAAATIRQLAADLDATRRERDAYGAAYVGAMTRADNLVTALDATRAERDAALAALPDAGALDAAAVVLDGSAEVSMRQRHALAAQLLLYSEQIDALDTAPAPVPAADVPNVPAFLAHRVNGGR